MELHIHNPTYLNEHFRSSWKLKSYVTEKVLLSSDLTKLIIHIAIMKRVVYFKVTTTIKKYNC